MRSTLYEVSERKKERIIIVYVHTTSVIIIIIIIILLTTVRSDFFFHIICILYRWAGVDFLGCCVSYFIIWLVAKYEIKCVLYAKLLLLVFQCFRYEKIVIYVSSGKTGKK